MILSDANLLIYAVNADSPQHKLARRWLEQSLSGTTSFGFTWTVMLAFLRITTHPKILQQPLSPEQAMTYLDGWLQQPCVTILQPGRNHWPILRNLINASGTAGNLTSDAHLAALAIEHGYSIYSADYDFQRFPGLTHVNPLVTP